MVGSGSILIFLVTGCEPMFPSVTSVDVINITETSAESGGIVTDEGSEAVVARGLVWGRNSSPTLENHIGLTSEGTGQGAFVSVMNDLSPSSLYRVRAYASSDAGNSYGMVYSFTTLPTETIIPEILTATPEVVQSDSAILGGKILSAGESPILEKGVYWGTSPDPESTGTKITIAGTGTGNYSTKVTGLIPNTTYYVRAYLINSSGKYMGIQVSFTTILSLTGELSFNSSLTYGSVSDIEGNTYKTIQTGTQTWMAENLRTTKYNDNTPITNVQDNPTWTALVSPAYSWYNNLTENKNLTGARYNWYAAGSSKICPTGWHVPTDNEWTILTDYLGGLMAAGGKMKEAGLTHWEEPNIGASNSSGFTAIPAGQRRGDSGAFTGLGLYDSWWSSTEYNIYKSWYRSVAAINTQVWRSSGAVKQTGLSLRCVKD